jgi:hypothetical protein
VTRSVQEVVRGSASWAERGFAAKTVEELRKALGIALANTESFSLLDADLAMLAIAG